MICLNTPRSAAAVCPYAGLGGLVTLPSFITASIRRVSYPGLSEEFPQGFLDGLQVFVRVQPEHSEERQV